MTKENALREATKIANKEKMDMAVYNDPISNNPEDSPDGPWGYCLNCARGDDGKLIIGRWAVETIVIRPRLT